MPLTVLSIAFPFAPVGPGAVGGAERILSDLDRALVAAGHTSLVAACAGSQATGKLFSIPEPPCDTLGEAGKFWTRNQLHATIDDALAREPVDVIHMHGLDFHEYTLPPAIPVLVTLHMPIAWYPPKIWSEWRDRARFCCVSQTQRRTCPPELRDVAIVENGVALPELHAPQPKESFAVTLGRICPEKNAHQALEAGTLAGTRVLLGGQVFPYPEHQQYFRYKIAPLLHAQPPAPRHEFLGPLSPRRSRELLGRAKCLLHPTLAPETSSLVAMEALAAGTPVIAYRSGALPEIVEDGVTGFLVDNIQQMAAAIRKAHTISPAACIRAAGQRFDSQRLAREYFHLYEQLAHSNQPNSANTKSRSGSMPEGIECHLLRTTGELEAFAPAWSALWRADPHATPFQSPEWLLPWWHCFGQPDLRAITILCNGAPIGLLPFYIYPDPHTGQRQLLLLGAGTSDYLDGLFAPSCTTAHIQQALHLLLAEDGWDALHACQLRPESRLLQTLEQNVKHGSHRFDGESCSRMAAVAIAELPRKIRRNAMYYRNRALRLGTLDLAFADESNWAHAFDALQRLHTARWRICGEPGVLADPRVLAWHREALPQLARSGLLRLCALRLNDETLGVLYSLLDPPSRASRTQYFYLTAYSPAHAELRPGTLLLALAMEHAAQEAVHAIDMLRGDEAYKQLWHLQRVPTFGFTLRHEAP